MSKKKSEYLGIGKTMFNTGATLLKVEDGVISSWETILSERVDRKKYSRAWPIKALEILQASEIPNGNIAHNSDIEAPSFKEDMLQRHSPFYEMLTAKGLSNCSEKFNSEISYIEHHIAHAYSSLVVCPYQECFVLVMDGGGSKRKHTSFKNENEAGSEEIEHTSLYHWDGKTLQLLHKEWLEYRESKIAELKFSNGAGSMYEKVAQFIFNDSLSSGKVMGLAGHGRVLEIEKGVSFFQFLEGLDWKRAYKGSSKEEWEVDPNRSYWQDIAATTQFLFEENLNRLVGLIKSKFNSQFGDLPLVLTGGCALNCTANAILDQKNIFPEIFVSPFPGDESISLGCAVALAIIKENVSLQSKNWEKQNSFFGSSIDFSQVESIFSDYSFEKLKGVEKITSLLLSGEVIGWFQGRSECGPRALGHRSILAYAGKKGLKSYLNRDIKFREAFRPYGASVLQEDASVYFEISNEFQNPFMSFATPMRESYKDQLLDICHVDGTCRMQTVMNSQNPELYELLVGLKKKGALPIVLNTSLNIMGEPIVESLEDAHHFFKNSKVRFMVIGNFLLSKGELP